MKTGRTGNAQRSDYLSSPQIDTTTLYLDPTGVSRKTSWGWWRRGSMSRR